MRDTKSLKSLFLVTLAVLAGGCDVSENPEFCEGHSQCGANPAGSFCHPSKHYCYAGCSSDAECQDPMTRAYLDPDKPVCSPATHECQGTASTDGARPVHDAGPAGDGGPRPERTTDLAPSVDGPKKKPGASCSGAAECGSGFCADGVCCDGTCDGTCVACNLAGTVGVCTPVPAGEDPAKECAGSGACSGSCDGKGVCSFAATSGKTCASATCAAGTLTTSACNDKGVCLATTQACGGYACVGATACKTSCASSADCTGAFQCVASKCVSQLPLGSSCGNNNDACSSKHCTDGACCKVASCGGVCKQCGAGGECLPANEGGSCGAPSCTGSAVSGASKTVPQCQTGACASTTVSCGDYLCDAAGASCLAACGSDGQCKATAYCGGAKCLPKKPLGSTCSASKECQAGACVDGVCCNSACTGTCMSCKLAGKLGLCSPVPDGQNPDAECTATVAACSGTCDGQGACKYPGPTTSCKAPSCTGQLLSQASCYKGGCIEYGVSCAGGYLCASATSCATSCTTNAQCANGYCDLYDLFAGKKNTCATFDEICYVDAKACPATGAGSKSSPFCKIQDCLNAKQPYVLVADGTYNESLLVQADVQLLALGSGAPLVNHLTGFVNSPAIKVQIVPPADLPGIKIINLERVLLRGLRVTHHGAPSNASGNLVSVVKTVSSSMDVRIESCDLWEAHGSSAASLFFNVFATGANLAVTDSALTSSSFGVNVVGIDSNPSAAKLQLSKVVVALDSVAGVRLYGGTAVLTDALVAFNSGKGVDAMHSHLTVDRAKIGANGGRGLDLDHSITTITNTLVNDNAGEGIRVIGNGTLLNGLNLKLVNVTASNNTTAELACPSWTSGNGQIVVENSIIYGKNNPIMTVLNCLFEVNHSTVKNLGTGTNSSADPKFAGGAGDPYQLQPGSPCLDGGSDAQLSGSLDVNGKPRSVNKLNGANKVDQGAYELQ